MILHPSVLALVSGSTLTAGLLAYGARWAAVIVRRWDLSSGSSLQLGLERRSVLVSAVVRLVMGFQLVALFLFVHTVDALAPLFTGAMCAAGVLAASRLGYPVLLLKVAVFVLAGLWLAVDHLDVRAPDYPLVRAKHASLMVIAPLSALEAFLQALYFAHLRPEVITSCCGSRFGRGGGGVGETLATLPGVPVALACVAVVGLAVVAALVVVATGRGAWWLGITSALALPVSVAAVISAISPYVYELPTHHCPFCLLQRSYHHYGYGLYATLLGGVIAGLAAAIVSPARAVPSLASSAPAFQRRLAAVAGAALGLFIALAAGAIARSHLHR